MSETDGVKNDPEDSYKKVKLRLCDKDTFLSYNIMNLKGLVKGEKVHVKNFKAPVIMKRMECKFYLEL